MKEFIDKAIFYKKIADREELARNRFLDTPFDSPARTRYQEQLNERIAIKHMIADEPAADVVEVVRCKDCKHFVCDMDLNHEEYPNEIEADGLCQITDRYCDMPHFVVVKIETPELELVDELEETCRLRTRRRRFWKYGEVDMDEN